MKPKPLVCPKCKGRLFFEGRQGEKVCTKCGYKIREADSDYSPSSSASPAPMAKMEACPTCGSAAQYLDTDAGGREIFGCSFCGARFTPMPKQTAPTQEDSQSSAGSAERPAQNSNRPLNGKEIYDIAKKNTVEIMVGYHDKVTGAQGSGFFFAEGYILTNAHVVTEDAPDHPVVLAIGVNYAKSEDMHPAQVLAYNVKEDIAIIATDLPCEHIPKIAKKMPETGEAIYAVGNTKGHGMCILEGIVADQLREVDELDYMMISANINHGNSGGPIYNTKGEVVGIASAGEGGNLVAMNYGIPINRIEAFIEAVTKQTKVHFKRAK